MVISAERAGAPSSELAFAVNFRVAEVASPVAGALNVSQSALVSASKSAATSSAPSVSVARVTSNTPPSFPSSTGLSEVTSISGITTSFCVDLTVNSAVASPQVNTNFASMSPLSVFSSTSKVTTVSPASPERGEASTQSYVAPPAVARVHSPLLVTVVVTFPPSPPAMPLFGLTEISSGSCGTGGSTGSTSLQPANASMAAANNRIFFIS